MERRKGARNLKTEFKDYAALASNDIELIEIDRKRKMSLGNLKNQLTTEINENEMHFENMKRQRSEINKIASDNNSAPIVKAENVETKAIAYDLAKENERLKEELKKAKKPQLHFGRVANMYEPKRQYTVTIPMKVDKILRKEAKKAKLPFATMARNLLIKGLNDLGHDIIFESDI